MTELIPCSKCGTEYTKSTYQKNKKMCKNCRNEYTRKYRTKVSPSKYYIRQTEKTCPGCGERKPIDQFAVNENSKHKRASKYCIECKAKMQQKANTTLNMLLGYAAIYQANRGEVEA
jgi:uncharacterized protein (DUF983 family)